MKKMRRFAAIAAAAAMTACMAVPMMSMMSASAANITITNNASGHTYEAYQIFDGTLTGNVLSDIVWGNGVTNTTELLGKIQAIELADKTTPFAGAADAAGVAKVLSDAAKALNEADKDTENAEITKAFADVVGNYLNTVAGTSSYAEGTGYTITGVDDGYYLIKDQNATMDGKDDAYTSYIVQVLGSVTIGHKSAKPTVTKEVWDNDDGSTNGDNAGWGQTADWMINDDYTDTTQFKLTATIPADDDFADYETYKLVFNDTMSEGVTFDGIASVKVNNTEVLATGENAYVLGGVAVGDAGATWTLTITDLLKYASDLTDGATVEVIYNAHLNEEADITEITETTTTNKNTVFLQYSNNPNWNGEGEEKLGETEKETVWVFTYEFKTQKVDGADNTTGLSGATFKLLASDKTTEIPVILDGDAYRQLGDEEKAATITSSADGTFNFKGFDAGTYYLEEINPPAGGYNKLKEPVKITIGSEHSEDTDGNAAATQSGNAEVVKIANNKGASLPSTGGIGTTLFYVIGGTLAAGAGVSLIAKKRMKNEE